MQRKLDVAMGLVQRPQVLFLDEPTTGLDPEARAEMWQEIAHLAAEEGLTILLRARFEGWPPGCACMGGSQLEVPPRAPARGCARVPTEFVGVGLDSAAEHEPAGE